MIVEVLRSLSDVLQHGTYGLQAKLNAMTFDQASDRPVIGSINNEADNIDTALRRFGDQSAEVRIIVGESINYGPMQNVEPSRITTVPVSIEYIVSNAIAETARAQGFVMCEAIVASLSAYMLNEPNKVRNNVQIRNITNVIQELTAFEVNDVAQLCAVKIEVEAKQIQGV